MQTYSAYPECLVTIYPYEGGRYVLQGQASQILSCTTHKNIRESSAGTFQLILAPGGPQGPNRGPSWTQIITPMSLVIIAMKRATHAQITMIGVVTNPVEIQRWETGSGVRRALFIRGADFQYFFTLFNYYTLPMLGARGTVIGDYGLPALVGKALLGPGTPAQIGAAWYNQMMAGSGGVMGNTTFSYTESGDQASFFDLMSSRFDEYPFPVEIPIADFFMASQGSWITRFMMLFPFPWYEFFVITAPTGYYQTVNAASIPLNIPGFDSASPTLVARVNPLPWTNGYSPGGGFTFDQSLWNDLTVYELENYGFINSEVMFRTDEARNFYILNPLWLTQLFGDGNADLAPFIYKYASWLDTASLNRYGYRPQITETHWLADPTGSVGQANATNHPGYQEMVSQIGLRVTSYFEPTPMMASGNMSMELRPDVMPGNIFRYAPFKDNIPWDFYINGVDHQYVFGGPSSTSLTLERGLPSTVYASQVLMLAIHTGNAQRKDGVYQLGLPQPGAQGLTPVNLASGGINAFRGNLPGYFFGAQQK